jgi:hypothetical protein
LKKKLEAAAKEVANTIRQHFRKGNKNGGWYLDYSELVADVFYTAFGHHLERYLLAEICKFKKPLALGMKGNKVVLTNKMPKKGDLVLGKQIAPRLKGKMKGKK